VKLLTIVFIGAALVASGGAIAAEAALSVEIKDHRFSPAELRAPADTPIILTVTNADPTPEEFESKPLKVEKIIPGGAAATIRVRPLAKGRYRFFGDYHEATAEGYLIVE
jgi:hypothetical protein